MKSRYINTVFITGLLTLGSLALSPVTQAKPPSEDRGNGNSAAENVDALNLSTTGLDNTAHGWFSLFSNTSASSNTADGFQALYSNTTGSANTATGVDALFSNTIGLLNTANGFQALYSNTTGALNTATGESALLSNTTGNGNTANGVDALSSNTIGNGNTANGEAALSSNTTGSFNTASGVDALGNNTTGSNNTAIGDGAGYNLTTGDNNIDIGGGGVAGESNTIRIGNGGQRQTFIDGIYGVTPTGAAIPVVVDAFGQLGTAPSAARFKKEIKPMDRASEAILALKPVTFHYKSDTSATPQFGLIAEEVAEVNPNLAVRDDKGEIYTVRYDAVNTMLLNEFLKEHRKVEEQHAAITELSSIVTQQRKDFEVTTARQHKEIQALTASLKEQAAQIQKVSARFEVSNRAPQTVANSYQ